MSREALCDDFKSKSTASQAVCPWHRLLPGLTMIPLHRTEITTKPTETMVDLVEERKGA